MDILRISFLALVVQESVFGTIFTVQAVLDHGFDLVLLFPIFWRTFAFALYHTLPIAVLLATGLAFGRMVADREVAAMKSFGISHFAMLVAPAAVGLGVAGTCVFVNAWVVPEFRFARRNIGKLILDQLQYLGTGVNRTFRLGRDNSIHIDAYHEGRLEGIALFAEKPDELLGDSKELSRMRPVESRSFPFVLLAEQGRVTTEENDERDVFLILHGVHVYYDTDLVEKERPSDILQVLHLTEIRIPLRVDDKGRGIKDMPNGMLVDEITSRRERLESVEKDETVNDKERARAVREYSHARAEYHRRLTFAAISFTFPMLAALIALSLDSRNRLAPFFVASILDCAVFFSLEPIGYELAVDLGFPWFEHLGNAGLVVIGVALLVSLERGGLFRRRKRTRGPFAGVTES